MKKIGLVLAGGGGRGAYQIGVWRALRENNLDRHVSAISGTSVGGLNAALFLQGDLERAEEIWKNISAEKILTPRFGQKVRNSFYEQREYHDQMYLYIRSGLMEIIDRYLDMSVFDKSSKNCYMTCIRTKRKKDMDSYDESYTRPDGTKEVKKYVNGKVTYFNMRGFSYEDRKGILLATSAIPFIFPKEKIGGYYYKDGGRADNLPVEPLYRIEKCEIIIVVHLDLNHGQIIRENFSGARIWEIRPKHDQGGLFAGILDFKAEDAVHRMQQGYNDTIEIAREIKEIYDREKLGLRQWEVARKKEELANQRIELERVRIQKGR